jgi:catechol 2,3-dioxygenase-like lactoylglutathione lyase family enzyme
MALEITGIHHHAVLVSDIRRAVLFYRDVLGLTPTSSPSTFKFADEMKRVRWFLAGPRVQIHLMPGTPTPSPGNHVALEVRDLVAARQHLTTHGVTYRDQTAIPGADRLYLNDPDGNLIELISWQIDWPEADPQAAPPLQV